MTAARVTVVLQQPVTPGAGVRSNNLVRTHSYVPGQVLRGACAAEWIRRLDLPTPTSAHRAEFLRVFERDGVFGPLHAPFALPTPLSVRIHRYRPTRQCATLWWDAALDDNPDICPDCQQELVFAKGEPIETVPTVARTQVALTPAGTPVTGALFTRRALPPGLTLSGWVSGAAVDAFEVAGQPITTLRLGGKRSTAGTATVTLDRDATPEPVEWRTGMLVLRLASPGIFVDAFGLPAERPDDDELSTALGVAATVHHLWHRWDEVAGWHVASGLPKPVERVAAAGSTYLVRCETTPTEAALRALRVRGIGLRRTEGFGALAPPPTPPTTLTALTGRVSSLRSLRDQTLTALIQSLRERTVLGLRPADDRLGQLAQKMPPHLAEGLQTVLAIHQPALYDEVLTYLQTGQLPQ